jgi:hypothetical protein
MTKIPSLIDQRRLHDGAKALDASSPEPTSAKEIREQLELVNAGIAALQSLDDLGPEANARAEHDQWELWKRLRALERRLVIMEATEN